MPNQSAEAHRHERAHTALTRLQVQNGIEVELSQTSAEGVIVARAGDTEFQIGRAVHHASLFKADIIPKVLGKAEASHTAIYQVLVRRDILALKKWAPPEIDFVLVSSTRCLSGARQSGWREVGRSPKRYVSGSYGYFVPNSFILTDFQ